MERNHAPEKTRNVAAGGTLAASQGKINNIRSSLIKLSVSKRNPVLKCD
jgi:hypothetical protein